MHEMRTSATDDPVAWTSVSLSVSLSVTRATVLTHLPDGATYMRLLLFKIRTAFFAINTLNFWGAFVPRHPEWESDIVNGSKWSWTWGSKLMEMSFVSSLRAISCWTKLKLQASLTPAIQSLYVSFSKLYDTHSILHSSFVAPNSCCTTDANAYTDEKQWPINRYTSSLHVDI